MSNTRASVSVTHVTPADISVEPVPAPYDDGLGQHLIDVGDVRLYLTTDAAAALAEALADAVVARTTREDVTR